MKCVLDVTALQYLSVIVPKYKGASRIIQRNETKPKIFVNKCKQCERFYTDIASLILHQVKCFKKVVESNEDYFGVPRNIEPDLNSTKNPFEKFLHDKSEKKPHFECSFCGKLLSNASAKKIHEKTQHRDGGHTCKYCGKHFRIKINGITHEKRVHHTEEVSDKPFKCGICGRGFTKVGLELTMINVK